MAWHAMEAADVLRALNSDSEKGLDPREVLTRRSEYGVNSFARTKGLRPLGLLFDQFKSPLALILIGAGVVTAFLHEYADALVILIVIIINTTIGVLEERRASHAFELLSSSYRRFATVLRAGGRHRVSIRDLVPGDIIILSHGDIVPADARVLVARGLEMNESSLTGEWQGIAKSATPVSAEARLTERTSMIYMGTVVASGAGVAVVTEIGSKTELGAIAETLKDPIRLQTPFQKSIASLSRVLSLAVLAFTALILLVGISRGIPLREILLIAVAVAVSAIPEGLPVAVTTTLAIGLERILKRGGLIRHLVAAETLGTTTVILTDKTGTLTEGSVVVTKVFPISNAVDQREVLRAAVYASDAFVEERGSEVTIHGRPVEKAIVSYAHKELLFLRDLELESPRIDYLPFNAVNRFAASLHRKGDQHFLYVCGAPESLLTADSSLNTATRALLTEQYEREMRAGRRLIAVAVKEVPYTDIDHHKVLSELSLLGFIALSDPLRASATAAVDGVRSAGTRVVMATGDNPETARSIAQEVGILGSSGRVLTGDEFEQMSATEQSIAALKVSVFARMLPQQKRLLLDALRVHGEVVAMTGDGVNDTPALVAADIGIALGSGSDVARDAADMVLVSNDFGVIVSAIEEGRRILDNLKKVVVHLVSTGFTEIILIASALGFGLPLPLLPVQILWHNVLSEGFLTMAFAFEPAEGDVMKRPPTQKGGAAILSRRIKTLILLIALGSALSILLLYVYLLSIPNLSLSIIRSTLFAALTIVAIGITFPIKSLRKPLHHVRPFSNPFLLLSFLASIILLLIAFFFPPLRSLLGLSLLPLFAIKALLVVGVGNILIVEGAKTVLG